METSHPGAGSRFGNAVAAWGDMIAVGAPAIETGLPGAVHVFQRARDGWREIDVLRASGAASGNRFGADVALFDDTLVVGGTGAWVFERQTSGRFREVLRLPLDDAFPSFSLYVGGLLVDVWGDTIAVSGSKVWVFDRDGTTWRQTKAWAAGVSIESLDLQGDLLLVGDPSDNETWPVSGAAFVHERDAGGADQWGLVQKLKEPTPGIYRYFGWSGVVAGDRILLSSLRQSLWVPFGSVYAFERRAGVWKHVQTLTEPVPPGLEGNGSYGWALALGDELAVVGAPDYPSFEPAGGNNAGRAFVYAAGDDGRWTRLTEAQAPPGSHGHLGWDVAVLGQTVVAGAPFDGLHGVDSGSVALATPTSIPAFTRYCAPGTSSTNCTVTLCAAGQPSATASGGFEVLAWGSRGVANGQFFYGTSGRTSLAWGNGTSTLCVSPPLQRCGKLKGNKWTGCLGAFRQDLNAFWQANPTKTPGAGSMVHVQLWVRDLGSSFVPDSILSDAIEFTIEP